MNHWKILTFALLPVVMLAMTSVPSFAQVKEGNNFEIGGGFNSSFIKNTSGGSCTVSGPGAFFEYRYALLSGSIDVGAQINWKYALSPSDYYDQEMAYDINYNNVCLKAVFDYNFLPQRVVNPFVGIGTGSGVTFVNRTDNTEAVGLFATLSPRVGVQIWRFRLTCDLDLISKLKGFSSSGFIYKTHSSIIAFNLGFSF